MADTTRPGTFWCRECLAEIPDALRARHIASHDSARAARSERVRAREWIIFWSLCSAMGVIGALLAISR